MKNIVGLSFLVLLLGILSGCCNKCGRSCDARTNQYDSQEVVDEKPAKF